MKDIQKEITPIAAEDLFIVLNHPNAKFDYPVHYHSDYEINLVMDTYGTRTVGDSEEEFDSLDASIRRPQLQTHFQYSPVRLELSASSSTFKRPN